MRGRLARSRLLLLSVVIALGIGLLVANQLLEAREALWRRAEAANANLLLTVSHVLKTSLGQADSVLQHTVGHLNEDVPGSVEEWQRRHHSLFDNLPVSGMGAGLVLDDQARVVFSSRPLPQGEWVFAEREYFQAHRDDAAVGLFVSQPFRSRLDAQPSVALSRRWSKPDGSFAGVAVITLKLASLRDLFSNIDLGAHSGINVFHRNGTILTRFPYADTYTGKSLAGTSNFDRFVREKQGAFKGIAALDQMARLYTFTTLEPYPVVVNIAQSTERILEPWRKNAIEFGAATLILMLGCIGLALMAERELHARQSTAAKLRRAETDLRTVLDSLPAMVAYWDKDLINRFSNKAHEAWFGIPSQRILGAHIRDIIGKDLFNQVQSYVDKALRGDEQVFDHVMTDVEGNHRHTVSTFIPDRSEGHISGFFVLVSDITDRKVAEKNLYDEKERFRVTLEAIKDAVITTDHAGHISYQNPAAGIMTGWAPDEASGRSIEDVIKVQDLSSDAMPVSTVRMALEQRKTVVPVADHVLIGREGQRTDIEESAAPIFDADGDLLGAVMVFHDVTQARDLALRMRHQAQHDALTKLPNRRLLRQLADRAIEYAKQEGRYVAVLYLDLDGFKKVNDTLGHETGDRLLIAISKTLAATLRHGDTLSRQGGDEFIALMSAFDDPEEACGLAQRLIECCRQAVTLGGQSFSVTVSIGISVYPDDAVDFDQLVRLADKAMYVAKRSGRNRYVRFDATRT